MSIKSTHDILRDVALEIIKAKIDDCSNKELENILECFEEESAYRNYYVLDTVEQIVKSNCTFKINDLNDFNNSF